MRRLTILFFTVVLSACGSSVSTQPTVPSSASSLPAVAMKTYTNAAAGYKVGYPEAWTVQENTRFVGPEETEIGTVFTPPVSDLAGTNETRAQAEIAVLDGACPVIPSPQQEADVSIDNISFEHDLWGDIVAGNTEETITYQTYRSNKCYRIVFYRAFCTPGTSCPADRTVRFTPGPQVRQFETMARSFKFL